MRKKNIPFKIVLGASVFCLSLFSSPRGTQAQVCPRYPEAPEKLLKVVEAWTGTTDVQGQFLKNMEHFQVEAPQGLTDVLGKVIPPFIDPPVGLPGGPWVGCGNPRALAPADCVMPPSHVIPPTCLSPEPTGYINRNTCCNGLPNPRILSSGDAVQDGDLSYFAPKSGSDRAGIIACPMAQNTCHIWLCDGPCEAGNPDHFDRSWCKDTPQCDQIINPPAGTPPLPKECSDLPIRILDDHIWLTASATSGGPSRLADASLKSWKKQRDKVLEGGGRRLDV